MVYGMYLSAGGLLANQYRMQVLSNNLANAETPGFKQDLTVVRERLTAARESMAGTSSSEAALAGLSGGSLVAPTCTSFTEGPIEITGQPLDVAVRQSGFFQVQTEQGERYTRDGRFMVNADGQLVTTAGFHPVLDEHGATIRIPATASKTVQVDANGQVRAGEQLFARLGVVDFEDLSLLRKTGRNLLEVLGADPLQKTAKLQPGAVEKSNVDATASMVSMIEVNRAYQLNATMVGLADATLGRAVNDVGRLG